METQIRNINTVKAPKYENPQLQQLITALGNTTGVNWNSKNLTDQDMELVADMLKTNTVRNIVPFTTYIRFPE